MEENINTDNDVREEIVEVDQTPEIEVTASEEVQTIDPETVSSSEDKSSTPVASEE